MTNIIIHFMLMFLTDTWTKLPEMCKTANIQQVGVYYDTNVTIGGLLVDTFRWTRNWMQESILRMVVGRYLTLWQAVGGSLNS